MQLWINNTRVPVIWEDNSAVQELKLQIQAEPIVVNMSMYGGNEQVGWLGKRFSSADCQTTTRNGDILLYSSDQIVVFYGSNTWAYTRLGRIDLPEETVTALLSRGDVTLTLTQ